MGAMPPPSMLPPLPSIYIGPASSAPTPPTPAIAQPTVSAAVQPTMLTATLPTPSVTVPTGLWSPPSTTEANEAHHSA